MHAGVREETAYEQYLYGSPLPVDTGKATA